MPLTARTILGFPGPTTECKCSDWKVKHSVIQLVLLTAHTPSSTVFRFCYRLDCFTRNADRWWKTGHVCEWETHLPGTTLRAGFIIPTSCFLSLMGRAARHKSGAIQLLKPPLFQTPRSLQFVPSLEARGPESLSVSLESIKDSGSRRWRWMKKNKIAEAQTHLLGNEHCFSELSKKPAPL